MLWISLVTAIGAITMLRGAIETGSPLRTALVMTAWFVGAFIATTLFLAIRAGWLRQTSVPATRTAPRQTAAVSSRR